MNWGKGFFRIWLLLAALWVGAAVYLNFPETVDRTLYYSPWDDAFHIPPPPPEWNFGCDKVDEADAKDCETMARLVGKGMNIHVQIASGPEIVFWRADDSPKQGAIYANDYMEKKYSVADLEAPSERASKRLAELGTRAQAAYELAVRESRVDAAKKFALYGLVPPLTLLVFGFALRWALAGFKKK